MSGAIARMPGSPMGSNVVPMPAAAPAPMAYPWPMPPGGFPAGCCPPGGMDALLQCYCDVQSATAFISKVVQDLAANDPVFQQSLVDAIVASGSNIPLIGVTNGTPAQPGQVGEYVSYHLQPTFAATANQSQPVTMGVLQPGDWQVWSTLSTSVVTTGSNMVLNPVPPGFSSSLEQQLAGAASGLTTVLLGGPAQALISVPTLVVIQLSTNTDGAGAAGYADLFFNALRVR